MPSIRIGFSTDFNLTSEQVGIGTTLPTALLDVRGQVRSDNASGSGGISTLTEYQGFLHSKQGIGNTVSIAQTTKGNLNSLSGELVISSEVTVSAGTSIGAGRLDSLTVTSSFDLPRGGSTNRPVAPEKGSTRFNQDLGQLEFYTGYEWRTVGSIDGSGRGRGVFGGGFSPPGISAIEYIDIPTKGNTSYFGELTTVRFNTASTSSSTRGLFVGGRTPSYTNTIDYITIASQGNAISFGTLSTANRAYAAACASSTRGVFGGGYTPTPTVTSVNVIDYVQFSTLGNAIDFGDLLVAKYSPSGLSSPVRGIFAGGTPAASKIEFITISSTGNASPFGDLISSDIGSDCGCSNTVRGIFGGSYSIQFITITSTGNALEFGDLSISRANPSATSSQIRGVFSGGSIGPLYSNTIDYVTIASTGNAQDFGDLSKPLGVHGGCSDSHGGLGGF